MWESGNSTEAEFGREELASPAFHLLADLASPCSFVRVLNPRTGTLAPVRGCTKAHKMVLPRHS